MQPWIKFYEAVTKPLPVASTLFLLVSTSFLLAAPDSTLARLGLSSTIANYRWAVGLGFVIALTWLVVTGLLWLTQRIYRATSARLTRNQTLRDEKIRVETEIPQMNSKEREIIGCLLAINQRVFTNTPNGGYASTLISKGIVVLAVRPGQTPSYWEVPYEVPQHVWDILVEHKSEFPYSLPDDDETHSHPWRIPWNA
jgi:hypothetical protein